MSAASTSSTTSQTAIPVLPSGLSASLPKPKTPWHYSSGLFGRVTKQQIQHKTFQTCAVYSTDPEYDFVLKCFNHHKPAGLGIRAIHCIHNPTLAKRFEAELCLMEEAAGKFQPTWKQEDLVADRASVIARWNKAAEQFSPIEVPDTAQRISQLTKVKILPLFHGSKEADSISSTGFTYFGKHHMLTPSSASNTGNPKSTDIGFFGSGAYFTNSARYGAMYCPGTLMLALVSMREPYPVVSDVPSSQVCKDMVKLQKGQGAYGAYNAHFIPVVSVNPQNPKCMVYHPCYKSQPPAWDELVVFQTAQTLPRFRIELGVDFPKSLSSAAPENKQQEHKGENKGETTTTGTTSQAAAQTNNQTITASSSALHLAAHQGDETAVKLLASNKDLRDALDGEGRTPLLVAAMAGHVSVSKILIDAGANRRAVDSEGRSALSLAAYAGREDVVRLFITDEHLVKATTMPPLIAAAYGGHLSLCQMLLKAGASPLTTMDTPDGKISALHGAIHSNNPQVVQLFVTKDLLEIQQNGCTPLFGAMALGCVEACRALLQAGANARAIAKVDGYEQGALCFAIALAMNKDISQDKCVEICEMLLKADADLHAIFKKDDLKFNPLQIAALAGLHQVCELLIKAGIQMHATIKMEDGSDYNALHLAAEAGHPQVCQVLLHAGINPHLTVGASGQNALHIAVKEGNADVVKLLATNEELLNSKDKNGKTPLDLAKDKGNENIVKILKDAGAKDECLIM